MAMQWTVLSSALALQHVPMHGYVERYGCYCTLRGSPRRSCARLRPLARDAGVTDGFSVARVTMAGFCVGTGLPFRPAPAGAFAAVEFAAFPGDSVAGSFLADMVRCNSMEMARR